MAFAALAVLLSVVFVVGALLGVDLYLHHKAERTAGLNAWGYRGPLAGAKRGGEVRVVMLGGSTVFGYGLPWQQAIPALLERELNGRLPLGRTSMVRVVNLGMNNEGAYSFPFTLRDFEFLRYDVVVFYEGYNDVTGTNRTVFRHASPVFRLTGYYPILPLVLEEKRLALTYGDIAAAYRAKNGETVVFTPPPAQRAAAAALHVAEGVSTALARQLDRFAVDPPETAVSADARECPLQWRVYCDCMIQSVAYSLDRGRRVVVATQPYIDDAHRQQQAYLRAALVRRFGNRPDIAYANLGDTLDLHDPAVTFDGMHLNDVGNARIAAALAGTVAEAVRQ